MSSLTHPSNTQPRPRAGHGDTSQVCGDGREWEDDTLLPEQELLLTTPSGAEASGKTGFQLTALDSPGGSRRGKPAAPGSFRRGRPPARTQDPRRPRPPCTRTPSPSLAAGGWTSLCHWPPVGSWTSTLPVGGPRFLICKVRTLDHKRAAQMQPDAVHGCILLKYLQNAFFFFLPILNKLFVLEQF